jgi:hypothetical protein
MPYPINTFATFADLLTYINNFWITNGVEEITGVIGNDVVNGLLTFIEENPLNSGTTKIESSGGILSAIKPVTVFMAATPTSFSWSDNVQHQYVFINTTLGNIPTITTYYDINLQAVNIIPAKSTVTIFKTSNNQWIIGNLPASGSGVIVPPLTGLVGGGGADDPANGATTFQSSKLINLGATNSGKIVITYAEVPFSSWGSNAVFSFDNITGTIAWINGNVFIGGDTLSINLNQ